MSDYLLFHLSGESTVGGVVGGACARLRACMRSCVRA